MLSDSRLISVPRVLADFLVGPAPYRRPDVVTVDDAVRWVQHELPDIKADKPRRTWARELILLRWLVDEGRIREDRP